MQISGLGSPSYVSYGSAATAAPTTRRLSFASVDGQAWVRMAADADALRTSVIDLRRMLERINPSRRVGGGEGTETTITVVGTAAAESELLDVDLIGTFAARRSKEAVNTDPPPFGPELGVWSGRTTATATVSGAYTGSTSQTYTFVVDRVQTDSTRIDVHDSSGVRVRRLNVGNDQFGQAFSVVAGLDVTFAAGSFDQGDSFSIVAEPRPSLPYDPDTPFDVPGSLEEGQTITNGTFRANGVVISVATTDTLNDVLARVTALTDLRGTFDATNQHVVFSHREAGDLAVNLTNDDTGFLKAFKLNGVALERGGDADPDIPMRDVPMLSSVASGQISVNGIAIPISRNTDSLNDVLSAIDGSGAGVLAAVVDGRVEISSLTQGEALTLDDGSTGFFAALGLTVGRIDAPTTTTTIVTPGAPGRYAGLAGPTASDVAEATIELGQRISSILNADVEGTVLRAAMGRIGSESRRLSVQAFGIGGAPQTFRAAGLQFDFRAEAAELFDTSGAGRRALAKALGDDFQAFHSGMTDELGDSGKSFLDELEAMAEQLLKQARGSIDLRL